MTHTVVLLSRSLQDEIVIHSVIHKQCDTTVNTTHITMTKAFFSLLLVVPGDLKWSIENRIKSVSLKNWHLAKWLRHLNFILEHLGVNPTFSFWPQFYANADTGKHVRAQIIGILPLTPPFWTVFQSPSFDSGPTMMIVPASFCASQIKTMSLFWCKNIWNLCSFSIIHSFCILREFVHQKFHTLNSIFHELF